MKFCRLWAKLWSSGILERLRKEGKSVFRYCPSPFRACRFGTMDRRSILPNVARYQLRYTRIFNSKVLLSVVIPVVKADFSPGSASRRNPKSTRVARFSRLWGGLSWIAPAALPNRLRYQLRHTRIFSFYHDTMAVRRKANFSVCELCCGHAGE